MMLTKLDDSEEVARRDGEEGHDRHLTEQHRHDAEVARLHVVDGSLPGAGELLRLVSLREPDSGRYDVGAGAHDATSESVAAMPETFVGTPAVIACTTSCCVVLSRS